jgi:hypothetical protein
MFTAGEDCCIHVQTQVGIMYGWDRHQAGCPAASFNTCIMVSDQLESDL